MLLQVDDITSISQQITMNAQGYLPTLRKVTSGCGERYEVVDTSAPAASAAPPVATPAGAHWWQSLPHTPAYLLPAAPVQGPLRGAAASTLMPCASARDPGEAERMCHNASAQALQMVMKRLWRQAEHLQGIMWAGNPDLRCRITLTLELQAVGRMLRNEAAAVCMN